MLSFTSLLYPAQKKNRITSFPLWDVPETFLQIESTLLRGREREKGAVRLGRVQDNFEARMMTGILDILKVLLEPRLKSGLQARPDKYFSSVPFCSLDVFFHREQENEFISV